MKNILSNTFFGINIKSFISNISKNKAIALMIALFAFYLTLAIINFIYNRSIWLDEAFLALNIIERDYGELLKPLGYGQLAPIGYLWFEKLVGSIFGYKEWALRLYAFLSYLGSLYFLYHIVRRFFKDRFLAWFVLALFVSFRPVLYFSAEIKPYMGDAFWGLLLWYLYLKIIDGHNKINYTYGFIISVVLAVWFSTVSVFFLTGIALHYILFEINIRTQDNKLSLGNFNLYFILAVFLWAISFLVNYLLIVKDNPVRISLKKYWNYYFMPSLYNAAAWDFIYNRLKQFFRYKTLMPEYHLFLILLFLGIAFMIAHKKYEALVFSTVPLGINLVLSYFKIFPFGDRLLIYATPSFALIIGYALYYLYKLFHQRKYLIPLAYLLLIIPFYESFIVLKKQFPLEYEEIKVGLKHINDNIKPGQQVYVYYASYVAFTYYHKHLKQYPNIKDNQILHGIKRFKKTEKDFRPDIPKLKDDVWLLFSHIEKNNKGLSDLDNILQLLQKNGFKILERKDFTRGAVVHALRVNKIPETATEESADKKRPGQQ